MLAERKALEEEAELKLRLADSHSVRSEIEAVDRMLEIAAPFIDEHATDPTKWKPSSLLRIGYCMIATSTHPDSALDFVRRHLDKARARFRAGLDPNPFLKD